MTKTATVAAFAAMALAAGLASAQARQGESVASGEFPKQPKEAPPALKITRGRPFSAGYVFINGYYMPPPYTVERYGTVIRVNGIQVSDQVVPWNDFLKTQKDVKVTKTVIEPQEEAPSAEPESVPEPESAPLVGETEVLLDDLFDDAPAKPKAASPRPVARPAPKPKGPVTVVTYSIDGPFVPNAQTRLLVNKINAQRTSIEARLRAGGYYFFGARYSAVSGDGVAARRVVEPLAEIMKSAANFADFDAALRRTGASALPPALREDLFRGRFSGMSLADRLKDAEEKREWKKISEAL